MNKLPYKDIINYYFQAKTIFSAHSPFVYKFMKEVMSDKSEKDIIDKIEEERGRLETSKDAILFTEFGAGSAIGSNENERSVRSIARNSLSSSWQCRILFNLIRKYHSKSILELGTSLGISTSYFAAANPDSTVYTFEGNPTSLHIANEVWANLGLRNIESTEGEFAQTLPSRLASIDHLDFIFLDGNHRKEATIQYYDLLKPKLTDASIVVVDDIYWSNGMQEAWQELIKDKSVAFSIDLFRMGVLFFDQSIMPKQHFKLIQYKLKPWSIGLFG